MPEGDEQTASEAPETDSTESKPADADFYKAEARKAFAARDKLRAQLRELETSTLSPDEISEYRALKEAQEKAESDRLRKEGEFEKSLEKINAKHAEALAEKAAEVEAARSALTGTLRGLAFANAPEWFGDTGKTVLAPEVAEAYFGKYVDVQDGEVVVKGTDGAPIIDIKTGRPAEFSEAIGELIDSLPNKNRLLRGSGKTGSGSSGGAIDGAIVKNQREIAEAALRGDPDALAQLKRTQRRGRSIWDAPRAS